MTTKLGVKSLIALSIGLAVGLVAAGPASALTLFDYENDVPSGTIVIHTILGDQEINLEEQGDPACVEGTGTTDAETSNTTVGASLSSESRLNAVFGPDTHSQLTATTTTRGNYSGGNPYAIGNTTKVRVHVDVVISELVNNCDPGDQICDIDVDIDFSGVLNADDITALGGTDNALLQGESVAAAQTDNNCEGEWQLIDGSDIDVENLVLNNFVAV